MHILWTFKIRDSLIRFFRLWPHLPIQYSQTKATGIQFFSVLVTSVNGSTCSLAQSLSKPLAPSSKLKPTNQPAFYRDKSGDRDIFNERPTREEQSVAAATVGNATGPSPVANAATIHTTLGDIHIRLFPQQAPKAVENFVGHARSSYFEGIIFHRVIPKFMIQTGDPLGDGTGGTSIWGREFEDEFSDDLKHDR
jgi:hypothetical protein